MAAFPALPLWTDAYIADCSHLTDAEHGLYLRILMLMWRSPQCRIPNDASWLARKLSKSIQEVTENALPLIAEFCTTDGNWIFQKRLRLEMEFVQRTSKKNSDAAKSRWNKEKDTCQTDASRHSVRNAPTPTPTPTYKKEESIDSSKNPKTRGTRLSRDWKPSSENISYAEGLGLNGKVPRITQDFTDYWWGKADQNGIKLDWDATWRTWVRKEADKLQPSLLTNPDKPRRSGEIV